MLLEDVNSWFERLLKMAKRGFVVPRPSHAARRRLRRELVVEMLLDDGEMRTRCCKTLKHWKKELEMLLEDGHTQTPARKTFELLKYYPRPPCAPSLIKSRFFSHTTNLLTYLHLYIFEIICIHAGNPRVPPRVLASGPKPCGGNDIWAFRIECRMENHRHIGKLQCHIVDSNVASSMSHCETLLWNRGQQT